MFTHIQISYLHYWDKKVSKHINIVTDLGGFCIMVIVLFLFFLIFEKLSEISIYFIISVIKRNDIEVESSLGSSVLGQIIKVYSSSMCIDKK